MGRKKVGEIIKEARENSELSQQELAKKIKIKSDKLIKIEAGERDVSPRILKKLSKVIDIDYVEMMYMIGEGIEISPLNHFIKSYYYNMNLDELEEGKNITTFRFNSNKHAINTFKKIIENQELNEYEKEFITRIIDDLEYQNMSAKEILKLIKSLKIRREKKCKNIMC